MTETRRSVLRWVGVAGALASGGCSRLGLDGGSGTTGSDDTGPVTVSRPDDGQWPSVQVDAANSGYHPSATGPTGERDRRWRFDGGGSTPVVVEDTVYVAAGGTLSAVDRADGTERWRRETDDTGFTPPAVVDGRVYLGSESAVYAFETGDGSEAWRVTVDGEVKRPPTVAGGVVYAGTDGARVYALDVADGTEKWQYDAPGPVLVAPAVVGDTVYAAGFRGPAVAIATDDGTERWQASTSEGFLRGSPTVVDGTVYLGTATGVRALDAGDGSETWHAPTDAEVIASPAVADGAVYAGDSEGGVVALETDGGDEQWRHRVPATITAPPVVAGDRLYVSDHSGSVTALATDGTVAGSVSVGDGASGVAVADGTLYVGDGESLVARSALAEGSPTATPVDIDATASVRFDTEERTVTVKFMENSDASHLAVRITNRDGDGADEVALCRVGAAVTYDGGEESASSSGKVGLPPDCGTGSPEGVAFGAGDSVRVVVTAHDRTAQKRLVDRTETF